MNPEYPNSENSLKRKPRAWVSFGENGHEYEYVFSTTQEGGIPSEIAQIVEEELGEEWEILYRDTRIEVRNKRTLGQRNDELVNRAFEKALGGNYTFNPAK